MPRTIDEYAEQRASRLSRLRVSRRNLLLAGGTAAAAGVVLGRQSFRSAGGVSGRHGLTLSGRHLAWAPDLGPAALRLTAQLLPGPPAGLRAVVDVGDAPGVYGTPVPARIVHLLGAGSQFYVKAALTGLRPGTTYHYRIRLSDGTTTGDAHVVTAPARGSTEPFTFTAFADVGTNAPPHPNGYAAGDPVAARDPRPAWTQIDRMATQRPAFTLLAGDICYADTSGTGLGTDTFDPYVWDVFLARIDARAAYAPWMFATGNHDMEPAYGVHGYGGHAARLDLPGNGPAGCPSVYRFTHGPLGVVALDANELSAEIRSNRGYSGGAQVRWLEDTLRTWRARPGIDFVVAFFHHCAYSTTREHASDGGVRDALAPLFDRYQVDLAIQGHNHVMERTDPIRAGRATRAAPDGSTVDPATDGTTYLCIGSGGRARYSFPAPERFRDRPGPGTVDSYVWDPDGVRAPETVAWSRTRYDGYAFLAVDVRPAAPGRTTTMTLRTLADALPGRPEPYTEIDRITLRRTAG
ncbi:MAG TPA: metallophosphoesterase family protein [Mycobacteriales bacterium]|nr:metallophosphoesterase family protein [Mycobacteriales bacterium]